MPIHFRLTAIKPHFDPVSPTKLFQSPLDALRYLWSHIEKTEARVGLRERDKFFAQCGKNLSPTSLPNNSSQLSGPTVRDWYITIVPTNSTQPHTTETSIARDLIFG